MSETFPRLTVVLHRLEVHAGPHPAKNAEPGVTWDLDVRPHDGHLQVWGYLRRRGEEGFGQAQAVAVLMEPDWENAPLSERPAIALWIQKYAAEVIFDVVRRALQSQAAVMDFFFDIDIKAPDIDVTFDDGDDDEHSDPDHPN